MRVREKISVLGALCMLLFICVPRADASVIATASTKQSVEVVSITGDGAMAVVVEVDILDLFAFSSGGGTTAASSSADIDGMSVGIGLHTLAVGEVFTTECTAISDSMSGDAEAFADCIVDINLFLDPMISTLPATVELKFDAETTAEVLGSSAAETGFAFGTGVLVDPDPFPGTELDSVFAEVIAGDGFVFDTTTGTFFIDVPPIGGGTEVLFFDSFAESGAGEVPEPSTIVVWSMIGIGAVGGYRLRQKRKEKKTAA